MDLNLIRVLAGALAVAIVGVIVWRRKRQASE
jgi:LPXTG-motif cell wall-anchored protein